MQRGDNINRKVGATMSLANMFLSIALGLVYTPFVLNRLGQSEYGIYSLASSLVSYLLILDLGFGGTLVRYISRAKAEGKEEKYINGMFLLFYSLIALVALLIGSILFFNIASFFQLSFGETEIHTLKKVFIIFLLNTVIAFPASFFSAIVRTNEKFIFANTITLVSNVLRHALGASVLFIGYGSVAMAVTSLAVSILAFLINLYYCFVKLHLKIGFRRFEASFYKEIFLFSFFILINIIVDELYANTDNIILGKFCGASAISVYAIGIMFKGYFTRFSTSISSVFLPHISKLSVKQEGIEKMSNVFLRVGHVQLLILSYVMICFIAYGDSFIELWVGSEYKDSYYIALIVIMPAIIPLSQNIGISVLQALNKHRIRSVMYLFIAVLNVIISIPLAIKFGGIGAAMGTAIGNVLGQIIFMNWYYSRIGLDIRTYWEQFFILIVKCIPILVIFFLCNMLPFNGWLGLMMKIVISQVVAVPYVCCFIFNDYEKAMLKSIYKRVRVL